MDSVIDQPPESEETPLGAVALRPAASALDPADLSAALPEQPLSNATFTIAGQSYKGKKAIRQVFAKAGPFQPQNHWESDTPAYKIRITVNGNRGTLYFECHYIDVDTQKVAIAVGADQDVRKVNGKWLITKAIASSVTLKP